MPTYDAIQVQQKPNARPFFLIAVTAEELLGWADVPRKKAEYLADYQRELGTERHKEITKFLQLAAGNVIPGAVIVSTREGTTTASKIEGANAWRVSITPPPLDVSEVDLKTRLKATYKSFLARLTDAERDRIEAGAYDPVDTAESEDADEDDAPPPSYLATLAVELRQAIEKWASLSPPRQQAVREYVDGTVKPGLIIDGQHRVFGAKNVTKFDVVLPVVLMPDLPVAEQVFHFYVLNNKAAPLKPTTLRNTVSTSLSDREIVELYDRLEQAGVDANEVRWTFKANNDEASPFRGLIDFGLGETGAFIKESVMFQVVRKFLRPGKKHKSLFVGPQFVADDTRLNLFFTLWSTVAERYPEAWKAAVEQKGGQLLMKATMIVVQKFLLDDFVRDLPKRRQTEPDWHPFSTPTVLRASVRGSLHHLPEEFFTRKWTITGLDTSEGHDIIYGQIEAAVQKFGEKIGHLPLFKIKAPKGAGK